MTTVNLENETLSVGIRTKGAELFSLFHKGNRLEYMWGGDPAHWPKTSPVLFPIVGTLKDDLYFFEGESYRLSRHGFARDHVFEIAEFTGDSVVFILRSSEETRKNYPFDFEFRLHYNLDADNLKVRYQVINTGNGEMYFSVGGHPAFRVPLTGSTRYEDYYLRFSSAEMLTHFPITNQGLISTEARPLPMAGQKLSLSRDLFYHDALVLKDVQSEFIRLQCDAHDFGIEFFRAAFPYLGIWAARNADFVCLEPWCGIADSVDHDQQLITKEGINKVDPGSVWERSWSVSVY